MSEISNKYGKIIPQVVEPLMEYRREYIRKNSTASRRYTDTEVMNHLGLERSKYYRLKNGSGELWLSDLVHMARQSSKPLEFWLRDYADVFEGKATEQEQINDLKLRLKEKEEHIDALKLSIKLLKEKV